MITDEELSDLLDQMHAKHEVQLKLIHYRHKWRWLTVQARRRPYGYPTVAGTRHRTD